MMARKKTSLMLAFLMLLGGPFAQARTFTAVGVTNGLEARVVPSVMLDSRGFLWVGSREGLFRYDGYRAQAFLPQTGNPDAISDIDIRSLERLATLNPCETSANDYYFRFAHQNFPK